MATQNYEKQARGLLRFLWRLVAALFTHDKEAVIFLVDVHSEKPAVVRIETGKEVLIQSGILFFQKIKQALPKLRSNHMFFKRDT